MDSLDNICTMLDQRRITFVQCWTNVENVGPTLYKCYTNVLCLLGCTLSLLTILYDYATIQWRIAIIIANTSNDSNIVFGRGLSPVLAFS